jgi:hypothetical protein
MLPTNLNSDFCKHIIGLISSSQAKANYEIDADYETSRTDLDTHANMAVVGHNSVIIADTGKRCQVAPFTQEYEALNEVDR